MTSVPQVPLGDLMATKTGAVDPSKYADEVFDLYSIPAYDRGAPELAEGSNIGSSKQIVEPRDVLLSKIVPHIRRTWVVGEDRGRRLIASGEWIVFRSPRAEPRYLRHVLRSNPFHVQFMQTVAGVGGSLLRARPAQVARIAIPLPPLSQQRRIAAILDQSDSIIAKRREALAQLDSLTQSIFMDMFGDPAVNPRGWPQLTVGSTAAKFSDGPFGSNLKTSDYTEAGVRVIRLQNIGVGELIDKDKSFVSEEHFNKLRKHECLPGDVLIGTLGDPNLRACIQPVSLARALNKADCVQLRPDPKVANAEYLCALLNQPAVESLAQEFMLGQTRVRISMGRLRGLRVPVPPLALQQSFATRIQAVESLKATHRAALAESEGLFVSLQHRAFSGEL